MLAVEFSHRFMRVGAELQLGCHALASWHEERQTVLGQLFTGLHHDLVQSARPYHRSNVTF